MKIWKSMMSAAVGVAGITFATQALADSDAMSDRFTLSNDPPDSFYHNMEFSADGFAIGTTGEKSFDHSFRYFRHHVRYGAGAGGNFFFCRYLGIGGDFYTADVPGPFVASASGNLIARYPIPHTPIAPYVFGGGGHDFDGVAQSFGQAGGGIEVRFAHHIGIFVDARYVFAGRTDDYGVGRAGVRVNF
jgi:hypothetical protein